MQITDTIADLLTRIRNASTAKHATVDVPASNMKKSITQILVDEGYVKDFQVIEDGKQGIIRITLKYDENRNPVIKTVNQLNWGHALAIGIFQLFAAIFPGASRSGSTIVGSIAIGIKREAAAKFTFFLAIPVMFGASLLKIVKYDGGVSAHEVGLLLVGMVTAFGVSLLIIKKLMAFIRNHTFSCFGWYRIGLGLLVLILGACGVIGGAGTPA